MGIGYVYLFLVLVLFSRWGHLYANSVSGRNMGFKVDRRMLIRSSGQKTSCPEPSLLPSLGMSEC